jgi:hypothetical protein
VGRAASIFIVFFTSNDPSSMRALNHATTRYLLSI